MLRRSRVTPARRRAVAAAMTRDGGCVAGGAFRRGMNGNPPMICGGPLEAHEVIRRSQGGDAEDPDHIIILCSIMHRWVTGNPTAAWEYGLIAWGREGEAGLRAARDRRLKWGMGG